MPARGCLRVLRASLAILCVEALPSGSDTAGGNDGRSRRRAELPRRGSRARPDAIRGRADLHRGHGPARRRGRQGREPERRRTRPHPRHRPETRRRRLLLHDLQRQQEIGHGQSEIAARPRAGQGHGEAGRRLYREHGAGHDREAGPRLGRTARAQPAPDLRPGQGVRRGQPVRAQPRLRHDRAGLRRQHGDHRRGRAQADPPGPDPRRHRHRHADGDLDPGRALRAQHHRQGTAAAGRDAGRAAQLHPRRVHQPRTGSASRRCAGRPGSGRRCRRTTSSRARAAGRTTGSTSSTATTTRSTGGGCAA